MNIDYIVSAIYKMLPHHKTILYLDLDLLCVEKEKTNYEDSYPLYPRVCVCKEEVKRDNTIFCDRARHRKHSSSLDL